MDSILAAFNLWDRIGADPQKAVAALGSSDTGVAERAQWMLVQGGAQVLPTVRAALSDPNPAVRQSAIRILAWQGDVNVLDLLRQIQKDGGSDSALASWAIAKIEMLHPAN